jgi:DNA mismatch endonuclease, patch repair protein
MMASIRGKNTRPELIVRRAIHAAGFRYRLHVKELPGKPDIVLPKYRTVILVNGCFWHGHDCEKFRLPKTRTNFWKKKINGNKRRDENAAKALNILGWRVAIVWECAVSRSKSSHKLDAAKRLIKWIKGNRRKILIRGKS